MTMFNKLQIKRGSPYKGKPPVFDYGVADGSRKTLPDASLAKLTRPVSHNVYLREKFFGILDKCVDKPVVWLSAPPGSGKTTFISSYIETRKLKCLWYQIDSGDRDLATFFHYMGIAAAKINPNRKDALPHLTPEYQLGIQAFTREYFSKLFNSLGKGSVIVFDNYQEMPVESIFHEIMYEGLSKVPKGVNIFFISRTVAPPVLSRMRPGQLMEVLTWDELRLTTEEVKGIASKRGIQAMTDEQAHNLLTRFDGWVTGLVLMAECGNTSDFFTKAMDHSNSEVIFNYFAGVLFKKLNDSTRDFLMKSSVLPTMTLDMAKELTGNGQAAQIISELTRKNYFIQSHVTEETSYQYHPLFREFLLEGLKKELNLDKMADIELRAARLLADNGHVESAVRLYRKAGDWDSLAVLICEKASAMLRQGRHQTLEEWLDCLPAQVMEEAPWLMFWKGSCRMPFDQIKSRLCFERAFEDFCLKKDPYGIFQSWCGAVEATVHGFDDLKVLDRWIYSLDGLLKEFPSFPSREIESRVTLCMFMALSFRAPEHPGINLWAGKTYAMLEKVTDPNIQAQISLYLVDYFIWIGELEKADVIVERLSKASLSSSCSPMSMIAVKLTEALNSWYHANLESCLKAVSDGLKIAETKGINVFNYFLYGHGAVISLTCGDLKAAEEYLKKAVSVIDDNKRFCASYYHHIAACHRLLTKDLSGALEHERHSLGLAIKVGGPFGEAMSRTGMALLHYELGERQKAIEEAGRTRDLALKINSRLIEFVCYLFEAYFALDGGDRDGAVEYLKKAMPLGSRKGLLNFHMWRPDIMTRLCVLALEEGIETEYVRRLVMKRGLFPENPPIEVRNWPWRLKIYVLGRFAVIKDGVPLQFNKKAPRKPIDMLRVIVSFGGKNVPEDKISDVLWQDAEGDAAHVAFTTTLKRLRCLLGVDDAILLSNGCVTLNPRYCWADVFTFDHLVARAKACSDNGADEQAVGFLEAAIEMFDAGFNVSFDEDPWAILFYERVKNKYIRSVIRLGSYWETAGKNEKAAECYMKGIENQPLSEELYQRLISCLLAHGQKAEALVLYNRLTKALNELLGIEPSSATKQLQNELL